MSEDGAEATFAPGQDLSSQEAQLSVETTEQFFTVHYVRSVVIVILDHIYYFCLATPMKDLW